jgi:DNA-binding transcriptional regulator WhiA
MRGYFRKTILNKNKTLQSYVIGIAIGDGNLSNPNGRATRLRITCDKKYPHLIKKIINSLQSIFPQNKVSIALRKEGCSDVSVYSNHLEKLLGWKAKGGSKFKQNVSIPAWINNNKKYKINCLRGLIETDGTMYRDRGYKMVMFRTIIPKLANDFYNAVISLGFKPNIYKLKGVEKNKYNLKQRAIYNIRLSKNVKNFLDLIKPEKL